MNKEYLKNQIKRLNTEFRHRLPYFLKYQLFTKILLSIVILPIFTLIINLILSNSDTPVLTNSQVIKFGFSKVGILVLFLFYIVAIMITLLELGGLIVVNNELILKNSTGDYFTIIKFVIKRIPNFFGIGGLMSILFIFFFIGFTGNNIFSTLGIQFTIPPFIKTYIDENTVFTTIYLSTIVLLIYFSTKWIFSLHFILLEGKSGLKALKSSTKLIKKNVTLFISYLITGILAILLCFLFIFALLSSFKYIIFIVINQKSTVGSSLFVLITIVTQFLSFVASFFIVPLFVYFVTDIFYTLREKNAEPLDLNFISNKSIFDKLLDNKRNLKLLFIGTILIFLFLTATTMNMLNNLQFDTKITAHKSNSIFAIENTLEALTVAINQDVDYAEIDVQESKDGKLFLFHDSTFKRIAGINKATNQLTYSEIKELNISNYNNGTLPGSIIPLLDEAIHLAKKNKQKLNIDVKPNTSIESIAAKLVNIIVENHFVLNCIVSSLDYNFLQEVKRLNPNIKVSYHMYLVTGDIAKLDVDIISVEETALTQKVIDTAHTLGKEVHVWTVNDKDTMSKFIKMGVDNIITDEVETLQNLLIQLKEHRFNAKLSKFKLGILFILLY